MPVYGATPDATSARHGSSSHYSASAQGAASNLIRNITMTTADARERDFQRDLLAGFARCVDLRPAARRLHDRIRSTP